MSPRFYLMMKKGIFVSSASPAKRERISVRSAYTWVCSSVPERTCKSFAELGVEI